jgi:hypothetical protein
LYPHWINSLQHYILSNMTRSWQNRFVSDLKGSDSSEDVPRITHLAIDSWFVPGNSLIPFLGWHPLMSCHWVRQRDRYSRLIFLLRRWKNPREPCDHGC